MFLHICVLSVCVYHMYIMMLICVYCCIWLYLFVMGLCMLYLYAYMYVCRAIQVFPKWWNDSFLSGALSCHQGSLSIVTYTYTYTYSPTKTYSNTYLHYLLQILVIGKSINFIRNCCNDTKWISELKVSMDLKGRYMYIFTKIQQMSYADTCTYSHMYKQTRLFCVSLSCVWDCSIYLQVFVLVSVLPFGRDLWLFLFCALRFTLSSRLDLSLCLSLSLSMKILATTM